MSEIMVAVDGSPNSVHAITWAFHAAEQRNAALLAVHAIGPPNVEASVRPMGGPLDVQRYLDEGDGLLDSAIAAAVPPELVESVRRLSVQGRPSAALLREAAGKELLVCGNRGVGVISRALIGSVSSQLAHHASCPLVVIPQTTAAAVAKPVADIVVGVDGSDGSRRALGWAIDEALRREAKIRAVWSNAHRDFETSAPAPVAAGEFAMIAEESLTSMIDEARGDREVAVVHDITGDRAADALIEASATADLVVVGSRGLGGFGGLLLGSVSQRVLHHASSPIAIIPAS